MLSIYVKLRVREKNAIFAIRYHFCKKFRKKNLTLSIFAQIFAKIENNQNFADTANFLHGAARTCSYLTDIFEQNHKNDPLYSRVLHLQ
jgi:hypothetical protein